MKSFVIHLERSTARRAQVEHILKNAPNAEVLPACDGSALSDAERSTIYPGRRLFQPKYPFSMSNGEIGCFESHKSAWRRIVDEGLDGALIIEDDVQIDPASFGRAVELAKQYLNQWGYVQFQVRDIRGDTQEVEASDGVSIQRPELIPLRTSAQMVSNAAAGKLLAMSAEIDRPVDAFLQMRWATGVDVVCVVPSGVSDRTAETGGSTLSKKRSVLDELKVSVPRLMYRRAIKGRSKAS